MDHVIIVPRITIIRVWYHRSFGVPRRFCSSHASDLQLIFFPARLFNPASPLLPFSIPQTRLHALVPHTAQIPRSTPLTTSATPACLPHQTHYRLLFRPALLACNVG